MWGSMGYKSFGGKGLGSVTSLLRLECRVPKGRGIGGLSGRGVGPGVSTGWAC
jgi:hypothetical protein